MLRFAARLKTQRPLHLQSSNACHSRANSGINSGDEDGNLDDSDELLSCCPRSPESLRYGNVVLNCSAPACYWRRLRLRVYFSETSKTSFCSYSFQKKGIPCSDNHRGTVASSCYADAKQRASSLESLTAQLMQERKELNELRSIIQEKRQLQRLAKDNRTGSASLSSAHRNTQRKTLKGYTPKFYVIEVAFRCEVPTQNDSDYSPDVSAEFYCLEVKLTTEP